jgi:uncharacterized membrane protein
MNPTLIGLPPAWEQVLGRLHPLVVHFPIALLLVAGGLDVLRFLARRKNPSPVVLACLLIGSLTALLAAGTGWLFAIYDPPGRALEETLFYHRWVGVAVAGTSLLALVCALLRRRATGGTVRIAYRVLMTAMVVLVVVGGHLGGEMARGEGFVLAPLEQEPGGPSAGETSTAPPRSLPASVSSDPEVATAGPDFATEIQPILEARCYDCHGPNKQKGKLRLDRMDEVLARDPADAVIIPGDADASELARLIQLPADDLDIMPNKGDPLTPAQIQTILAWIDAGARFSPRAGDAGGAGG